MEEISKQKQCIWFSLVVFVVATNLAYHVHRIVNSVIALYNIYSTLTLQLLSLNRSCRFHAE